MASSLDVGEVSINTRAQAHTGAWSRLLLPSFSDFLFVAVLVWLFAAGSGWYGLLASGDTGFHIRTGEWVLENGRAPRTDLYSFSKEGQVWFAWEWLTDVLFAWLHQNTGFKGLLLLAAVVLSGYGTILFRYMIWRGATPFAGLLITLIVFGASTIHYLARPHIFTLLGLTMALWLLEADRRSNTRWIWILVPATSLWANMHGGFLSLIVCVALLAIGTLMEAIASNRLDGAKLNLYPAARYACLTAACGVASLLTPYGWELHRHVLAFLQNDWFRNSYQEFQSPSFRSESASQFEMLLFLGLIVIPWLVRKREFAAALWILFWGHNALSSARHIPLFMLVAGPWVALGMSALWQRATAGAGRKSILGILAQLSRDLQPGCSRSSLWIPVVSISFLFIPGSVMRWPQNFPDIKFPVEMANRHESTLVSKRVFTMDQWANYLIYRYYPRHKVFIDGRGDFYGEQIGRDYLDLLNVRPGYENLLEKYRFEAVLVPANWGLTQILRKDPRWKFVDQDSMAVLFERIVENQASVPVPRNPL